MSKTYEMNLSDIPFRLLKSGKKSVEMRLNKNGRDKIQGGDFIVFNHEKSGEKIKVKVLSVSKFSSFDELYDFFPKDKLGYGPNEKADPKDMLVYYSKEEIKRCGVLGIEVEIA